MAVDAALRIRFLIVATSCSDDVFHNKCGLGTGHPRDDVFTGNGKRAANRDVELVARVVRALSFNHSALVICFAQQAAIAVAKVSVDGAGSHLLSMEKPPRYTSP